MILKHRLFERQPPSREAKLFIIYCEGKRREPEYFWYFHEISSRIKLEVVPPEYDSDNSPKGLYQRAFSDIIQNEENKNLKYYLQDNDEVWFVIDTDEWGDHIDYLKTKCSEHENWYVAQSNPCFEVWLYYHFEEETAQKIKLSGCVEWKRYVNALIPGGFDSRKHPLYISDAINNSEKHFIINNENPEYGTTELFKLGKQIYPLIKEKIEQAKKYLGI
jgi:hypothetical protein